MQQWGRIGGMRVATCGLGGPVLVDVGSGQSFVLKKDCGGWECEKCSDSRARETLGTIARYWEQSEKVWVGRWRIPVEEWDKFRSRLNKMAHRKNSSYIWVRRRVVCRPVVWEIWLFASEDLTPRNDKQIGWKAPEVSHKLARLAFRLPGVAKIGSARDWFIKQSDEEVGEKSHYGLGWMTSKEFDETLTATWQRESPDTPEERRRGMPYGYTAKRWAECLAYSVQMRRGGRSTEG